MFTLLGKIIKYTLYLVLIVFLLLSVIPYFFTLKNPKLTSTQLPFPNSRFEVNGDYFVHYRLFVPKKVERKILLIHGFSGSTYSFHKTFDSLVNHNCLVVAVDIPPFGYSVKNKELTYTDTIVVNLIKRILTKTDSFTASKQQWCIAGHSMGVYYASKMVSHTPALFSKQIFMDGYYNLSGGGGVLSNIALYPPFMRLADVVLEKNYLTTEKFSELLSSAYGRKPEPDEVKAYMTPFSYEDAGASILKWSASRQFINVNEEVIRNKPTLLIWGSEDKWVPFKDEDFKLNLFKDITFKRIEGAGHIPMETHADLVNKYLLTFMED